MKMKVSSPVVGVVSCESGLGDRLHVLGTWVVQYIDAITYRRSAGLWSGTCPFTRHKN